MIKKSMFMAYPKFDQCRCGLMHVFPGREGKTPALYHPPHSRALRRAVLISTFFLH